MNIRSLLKVSLALLPTAAFAQSTATSGAVTASTTIYTPITIATGNPLAFGAVVPPSTGTGTVVMNPTTGSASAGGNVSLGNAGLYPPSAASFSVGGNKNSNFSLQLPSAGSITLNNGGSTLTVDTFTASCAGGAYITAPTGGLITSGLNIGSSSPVTVTVGATLHVPSTATTGTYSNTFTVTVAYD